MVRTNCKPPQPDVHKQTARIGAAAAFTETFFGRQRLAAFAFGELFPARELFPAKNS
jgi:hypothetical protein